MSNAEFNEAEYEKELAAAVVAERARCMEVCRQERDFASGMAHYLMDRFPELAEGWESRATSAEEIYRHIRSGIDPVARPIRPAVLSQAG